VQTAPPETIAPRMDGEAIDFREPARYREEAGGTFGLEWLAHLLVMWDESLGRLVALLDMFSFRLWVRTSP
jgi:hypothetical protein